MRANELLDLDEGVGQAGVDYENRVVQAITDAQLPILQLTKTGGAGYGAHEPADIEATLNGKPFFVECKSAPTDTMGSFIMFYNKQSGEFIPSKRALQKVEPEDLEIAQVALQNRKAAIDSYLDEIATREPVALHQEALNGVPFRAEYNTKEAMKQEGYQRAIQQMVTAGPNFIANMYNSKNTYYIQVGGRGLFYMGKDIFNLGVPKFNGEVKMEIRFKPAGDTSGAVSRKASTDVGQEIQARKMDLICGGKIVTKDKSPFTLDDPESIRTLFNQ